MALVEGNLVALSTSLAITKLHLITAQGVLN
jgi:hypothetical protein